MGPKGPPRSGAGRPARQVNTVAKEQERIGNLSNASFEKTRQEVAELSADNVRKRLKTLKADEWKGDDSGLLKAKTFKLFGLGEPPRKMWTKTSAIFMLKERGYVFTEDEVDTKQAAVATLEKARRASGADKSAQAKAGADTVSKRLFVTPQTKDSRRAALMKELQELEVDMPAAKKPRGGNGPIGDTEMQFGWASDMPNEERRDHGESWIRGEDSPELSGESDGWNYF